MIPPENSPDAQFENLVGNKIASGTSRCVHELKGDNYKVIKVAKQPPPDSSGNPSLCNKIEWELYNYSKNSNLVKIQEVLAEVFSISETGKYLIMEKLNTNLTSAQYSSKQYPICISDPKNENFGMDSQLNIKMLDYAALNENFKKNGQIDTSMINDQLYEKPNLAVVKDMSDTISKLNDIFGDPQPPLS